MVIGKLFEALGGVFVSDEQALKAKLAQINCFVFDWDGVFNDGQKNGYAGSNFSESDSSGINMLRFSYWLRWKQLVPTVIISGGSNNDSILRLATREHFNVVAMGVKNKQETVSNIMGQLNTSIERCLFVFDDFIDLSVAQLAGLSVLIKRKASPLFNQYLIEQKMADYITGCLGGNHAVREVCELIMGLSGNFDEVIKKRTAFFGCYERYMTARNAIVPQISKERDKTSSSSV